jgi:Peptidase family S41
MKKLIVLVIISFSSSIIFSQVPSLNDEIDSLAATIKDTYVGYPYKVKGKEFDALVQRVKQNPSKDTFALLSQLTSFFKDMHLELFDYKVDKQKIDTQQCKKDSQMVERYFANKKRKDIYEGYWLNERNHCVIGLIKVQSNPTTYYGYVVESRAKAIPGYCLLKMVQQKDGTYYTDCMSANFGIRLFSHAKFKNNNTLWATSWGGKWLRQPHYQPGLLNGRTIFAYEPAFEVLDDKTVLLKMPTFDISYKSMYDSIIKANDSIIRRAHTLIVDIRNNTGGRIKNYFELFPYAYTQPIVHCGVYVKYSKAYVQDFKNKAKEYLQKGDTANARAYDNWADTVLNSWAGKEVYYKADTLAQQLPVLPNPKNIAIIANYNCLSAAELMLLNFKQSSKVTVFGERTGGAVDYLATIDDIPIVGEKYSLFIAFSKRALTAQQPSYDGVGIKPDVEIGDEVADWVAFVKKYYEERR